MLSIHCTNKITEADLKALTQPERKRLGEIVREMMTRDKHLTRQQAVEKAYPLVLAESVPWG
jgi:hypothetical protein